MRGDRAKRAAEPTEPVPLTSVADGRAELDQLYAQARLQPRKLREAQDKLTELVTLDLPCAEGMLYARRQDGEIVTGATVRFAEAAAWAWGNCRSGSRILHVGRDYVEAEGFFHDLEANTLTPIRVRRSIRANGRRIAADAISGASSAAASIARRTAILTGIPHPFVRAPFAAVEDMIRGDLETLPGRLEAMLIRLAHYDVTLPRVLAALEVEDLAQVTPDHILTLHGLHSALVSDDASAEEVFPDPSAQPIVPAVVEPEGFSMNRLAAELGPMDVVVSDTASPPLREMDGGSAADPDAPGDSAPEGGGDLGAAPLLSPDEGEEPALTELQRWGLELRIQIDGLTDADTLETVVERAQPQLADLTSEHQGDALAVRAVIMKARRRLEAKAKPVHPPVDDRDETVPLFPEGVAA